MRRLFLLALLPLSLLAQPQPNPHPATPADRRLAAVAQRRALQQRSWLGQVPLRSVGPTVMSGRVVDLDVNPADPTEFYVAFASGGLWHTANNGQSFRPLLDTVATMTIGDIAVHWPSRTLWVGTGENNSSRSSYAGVGVYRSPDGGKTWAWMGLPESQHIGRIVTHPTDPRTAWVAVLGNLYSRSANRGVYKTADGGATWTHVLKPADELTGAIDLVIDPTNPAVLTAATWQRTRRAWNFEEAGAGSGIWRSTDGGTTWQRIAEGSGFPTGDKVGRIGLATSADGKLLFAVVDHQGEREQKKGADPLITKAKLKTMSKDAFAALPIDSLNTFLDANGFPQDLTADKLIAQVKAVKLKPSALYDYLYSANEDLFNAPVRGAELYRSADGGATWVKTHRKPIDDLFFTYGYYFAQVRVDPLDAQRLYLLGVPAITSADGGATWSAMNSDNSHADHHALWLSATRAGHLVLGNDGGVNVSYDHGKTFVHCNTPAVGQFYAVAVDQAKPYNLYGGLQDNGVWVGPSTYRANNEWYSEGQYPYKRIYGGDGMQVQIDPRDNATVYTGLQFGNYVRTNRLTGQTKYITPRHTLGERPYRWNWQTPIHLSVHNPDILYMGANKVLRSLNRGDSFEAISPDLTRGPVPGDVPYGTLSCLVESPLRFGLLWAGSDDGRVHVSRDGGASWADVSVGLPEWLWVSRIELSRHDTATALVALNGYRWDHFESYLYQTTDYGRTWVRLGAEGEAPLPAEPINVVRRDPANANLLYVGTDHGLYASLDGGRRWMSLSHGALPETPVHDLAIQARDKELLIGTHGRSLYIAPLKHMQALTPELTAKALHPFALDTLTYNENWGRRGFQWSEPRRPELTLTYWAAAAGRVALSLVTKNGTVVVSTADTATAGLNYQALTLTADSATLARALAPAAVKQTKPDPKAKPTPATSVTRAADGAFYLRPGTYTLRLTQGSTTAEQKLVIKPARERPRRGGRTLFEARPNVEPHEQPEE